MVDTHSVTAASLPVRRPASALAPWLLLAAPLVALLLAAYTLLVALMVFPLGDLTPLFVLAVSLLARRWEGFRSRLFGLSAVIAGIMVLEWVLAYFFLSGPASVASPSELQRIGHLFIFYVVQLSALLALFASACLLSRSSVLRLRGADESAT